MPDDYERLRSQMAKFGLELEKAKSQLVESGRYLANAKAKRGESARLGSFDFLGFTFYCGRTKNAKLWVIPKTSSKKFRQRLKDVKLCYMETRNKYFEN